MRIRTMGRRLIFSARTGGRRMLAIILLASGLIILLLTVTLTVHFRPMVAELALATATDNITIAVNETVAEIMSDGQLDYDNLVTLEKDGNGNITALVTNIANINILQAQITNAVAERFVDSDITHVTIPLGNLIGWALLSGRGPRISVDILSITNVSTSFRNEFTSAGINQTRHQIIMDVNVSLGILLAGTSGTGNVLTEISIAETVIVGSVPGTYATIE